MPLRALILPIAAVSLAGCALSQPTPKIAIDYNRDFAKSRNEMLLLNVLRAAAREPLQFSTLGNVSGQVGNSSTLKIPITNLIGGKNIVSPDLTISDGINPTVAINPLAGKDFATGILKPMDTQTIQLFLHNGWDAEFLLPLIVGGVLCPDDRLLLNSGEYLEKDGAGGWQPTIAHKAFKDFFSSSARQFSVGSAPAGSDTARNYTLTDKEALAILKDGLGSGFTVKEIADASDSRKMLKIIKADAVAVEGLAIANLCETVRFEEERALVAAIQKDGESARSRAVRPYKLRRGATATIPGLVSTGEGNKVMFRSVGSIIQYLGESHRVRYLAGSQLPNTVFRNGLTYENQIGRDQILFKIDWGLRKGSKAVKTDFQDIQFYVPRLLLGQEEGFDRTLKTLSFLDQLIALHTSEASFRGAQPVISVNQ